MASRPLKPKLTSVLRRRQLLRRLVITLSSIACLLILLDHLGLFGYRGDDLANFASQRFHVDRVTESGNLVISSSDRTSEVRLTGVLGNAGLQSFLAEMTVGKTVILMLDPLQTRDASGHLLAIVYLSNGDCLNVSVIRAGGARVDPKKKQSMLGVMRAAEADARKHFRGVWRNPSSNAPAL